MKVQDVKKVCMVCPPLVVIVPPVEDGEIQSDPFVAYETITTPLPHFGVDLKDVAPPPPQPSQSVHPVPFTEFVAPLPQPPVPHAQGFANSEPHPPHPYTTADQLIELV